MPLRRHLRGDSFSGRGSGSCPFRQSRFEPQELKDLLAATADKIGNGYDARGHSDEMGFGRINAGKAVEEALKRVR